MLESQGSTKTGPAYQETGPVVGLIPAAGRARRLGRLPVSKEILPVDFQRTRQGVVPKVACQYLLDRFRAGGVERAFLVIRRGKEDIPRHLGSGDDSGVSLAYLVVDDSASVPETLDRAHGFVAGNTVVLGFPDLWFTPEDAYATLLERHRETGADVTLGLFPMEPARRPTTDMVRLGADGRVEDVEVRPQASELEHNWLLAVWGPRFTDWLHGRMSPMAQDAGSPVEAPELKLGSLLRQGLAEGLHLQGVPFDPGGYLDMGTPEGLARAREMAADARDATHRGRT